jgi:maleate isomerase
MTDTYGYRLKLGVVTPSVNTTVQPEYDAMRPAGVTNHLARIFVPDIVTGAEGTLEQSVNAIDQGVDDAVERVLTCDPAAVVLGVSLEAIYGDPDAGQAIEGRLRRRFGPGLRLVHAGTAIPAALRALGVDRGPIALLTPYGPGAHAHLESFMKGCGYELGQVAHLVSASLMQIAHNPPQVIRAHFRTLIETKPAAVVQFGANLPAAYVAAEMEARYDVPVLAINTTTYWHALRENGIPDRIAGFGRLLSEH